jgi:YfiH family protein
MESQKMTEQKLLYYQLGKGVTAFSTTRQGGYSEGRYGEFNINRYCGDSEDAIRKNREALCRLLDISDDHLLMPHQVHQTEIAVIDEDFLLLSDKERLAKLEGFDALMTNVEGVCIGVSTADCIPVLLYDPVRHAACAIHAGWRGTIQRIVEKTVSKMATVYGSCPSDILAQIGPGISLDSFEVGDEVYDAFAQAGFDMDRISCKKEKPHIDLPMCNFLQLTSSGVPADRISLSQICTFKQYDTYFSARRLGISSGRIFTAIMLSAQTVTRNRR